MQKIRKISSAIEWHGYEITVGWKNYNWLYIAKENGRFGIIDDMENVLLYYKYDSITPLGRGVWLLRKGYKYGLISLSVKNYCLCIGFKVPCRYDYIYRKDNNAVSLCTYEMK